MKWQKLSAGTLANVTEDIWFGKQKELQPLLVVIFVHRYICYLKGLSYEIDFKNFDKNLQNLTLLWDAAGF